MENKMRHGSPRITRPFQAQSIPCSHTRVESRMKQLVIPVYYQLYLAKSLVPLQVSRGKNTYWELPELTILLPSRK